MDCWTCPWLDFSHTEQDDDETTAEVAMKSGNGGGGRRGSGDAKVAQRGGNLLAFFSKKPAHHGAPPASAVHGNEPPASHSNKTTPFAGMLVGAIHRNGKTPASALVSVASGQSESSRSRQDSRTVTRESTPSSRQAASVDTNHATPPSPEDRVAVKSLRSVETPPTEASELSSPETPPTPNSANHWESAASERRRSSVGNSSPRTRDASAYETPAAAVAPIFNKPKVRRPASSEGQKQDVCKPANKKHKQSNQLFLDFGQKSFGKQSVCRECGMLFMESSEEDVKQHDVICKDYKEGVVCLGWKNERSVSTLGTDERILEIRPGDAPSHWRKVEQVKAIVDKSMGFAQSGRKKEEDDAGMTCYLYIAKRRVVGLLVVKRIHRAYRLHEPPGANKPEKNKNTIDDKRGDDGISRSLKSTKAILGVHQIWSHGSHRGRGIASSLVTAARDNLVFGMMVPAELVAFSSPTDEGLRFAKRYVGTDRPLIYDIH